MPRYEVALIPVDSDKSDNASVTDREERNFADLGEALQCGREMYSLHQDRAAGFRILNALGRLIHEWRAL